MGPSLFQQGLFDLHSGEKSNFKIDCDALTDEDIVTLAVMISEILPPFYAVRGVPRGGMRIAEALVPYSDLDAPRLLIVDDVLTTGASMEQVKQISSMPVFGAVIFARGPCPDWITPLFQMPTPTSILVELQATILEYEHALEHVIDPHVQACPECQRLARGALDGDNRADFREIVEDQ